jgi:Type I phosphodiesterase / nucleotide pyrophosphatase
MMVKLARVVAAATAFVCVGAEGHLATRTQPPPPPSLLVIIVVDQMRFDYLDRLDPFWKRGFRRLLEDGAVFEQAYYPYLNTVTCVGHATISTGTLPARHGIILNEWLQRPEGRRKSCTEDPAATPVPYGPKAETIGHSAHRLRVPTLGDRLRGRSPASRVVTLSMKARSAVMLAGHGGTATWFSEANTWATSTAFAPLPTPEVAAYVQAHPVEHASHIIWRRLYEAQAYRGDDSAVGERPKAGWTDAFPHPLKGAPGSDEARFYELWERSPYSDAYLGEMSAALVQSFALGQRDTVDLLGISFSALDYVGHDFGPDSHEAQDTLFRLDRVLGDLFDVLDKGVGRDRYVVALSADHGVAPIPEQGRGSEGDAGRLLPSHIRAAADAALAPLGAGPHIAHVEYTDLYLTEATRARLASRPNLRKALVAAIAAVPGVDRVFDGDGLEHKHQSDDRTERAAALSFVPGESGDLIVVPKPFWVATDSSATTHGTLHAYDQHVPVILMGRPYVKAGRYHDPVSPADIAPSLASLVGLPMPGVDGHVLRAVP